MFFFYLLLHTRYNALTNNCTDVLQPMDLSVQKIVKNKLRSSFELWFADTIAEKIHEGEDVKVSTALSILKPLGAKWLVQAHQYLKCNPEIILNGFKSAGLI